MDEERIKAEMKQLGATIDELVEAFKMMLNC
jgi:hypothetical protein